MNKIFLVGLANAGKSTIFNKLTGSDVHTGNWHGVTVNKAVATCNINNQKYLLTDLPGVYGLTPFSPEEAVTVREILNNQDSIFVNVIDANNLERSLNLTLQLIELGLRVVVALNFIEDSKKRGVEINLSALSNALGVEVLGLEINTKNLYKNFSKLISRAKICDKPNYLKDWKLEEPVQFVGKYCDTSFALYNGIRLREGASDDLWNCEIPLSLQSKLKNFALFDGLKIITNTRTNEVNKILNKCLKSKAKNPYGSSKFDKIFLNKITAIPVFLSIMLVIFYITFGFLGDFLSNLTNYFFVDFCGGGLIKLMENLSAPIWLVGFVNQVLIGGVGSVLSFLPQVILLFLFLEILEQSGYLSRLAWLLENSLSKFGLSGRSIFSLLMGFGCSTTAIPTTATLQNGRARTKTVLLIPFMSCSAKLPVYSAIAGAFFGAGSVLVIFALYLLGIAVALLLAVVWQKIYPTLSSEEIVEFTPLRMPKFKKLLQNIFKNIYQFLSRIWTVLLACTIIIWLCNNFTITFQFITNETQVCILETISKLIAPIFAPLGFGWGAVCALIFGLVAKELILSGIAVLNGVVGSAVAGSLISGNVVTFTPASCLAFLVFCLLYSPCVSALSQLKHIVSKRVFWGYIFLQFAIAYGLGALTYLIVDLVGYIGGLEFAWLIFASVCVILCLEYSLICLLNKNTCASCRRCDFQRK